MLKNLRWLTAAVGILASACAPPPVPPSFHPFDQAISIVEANRALTCVGLKAHGSARGYFVDDSGVRRPFDLEARLQVVAPDHFRMVMEHALGGEELQVGLNAEKWWLVVQRPQEQYLEGARNGETRTWERVDKKNDGRRTGMLPLKPSQLVEALGLSRLRGSRAGRPVQRVVEDYQQLIYVSRHSDGSESIDKEYWLDRYHPFLIRRILFRNSDGRVAMSSELDKFRPVGEQGALLPHEIRLNWPLDGAAMTFRISRWREMPEMTPQHRAFISPRDRGQRFEHEFIEQPPSTN